MRYTAGRFTGFCVLITDNCQEPIGEGLDLSEVLKTITKKFGYVPNEI